MQAARQRMQEQHHQDSHEHLQSRVQKQRTASVKAAQELARRRDALKQEQERHAEEEAAVRCVAQQASGKRVHTRNAPAACLPV